MITAQDINKLRKQTSAGIMDCKKALTEGNGDFDKAIEILRKKGQKISAARATRAVTEGAVFAKTNNEGNCGVMIALSCETDFVAKNEVFQQLGKTILDAAFKQQPTTLEELLLVTAEDGVQIQEKITELVGKIGEKVTISTYAILHSEAVVSYIHVGNKLGVLVGLEGDHDASVIEAGKDVAMHIAAMNPLAIDKDGIDTMLVDEELDKENTLLHQPFIKNSDLTIKHYLECVAPNLRVVTFERVSIVGQ